MFNSLSSEYIPSSVNESKPSYSIGAGSSFAFRLLLVRLSSIIIVWFYEYTNANKSFATLYPCFCRILQFKSPDFIKIRLVWHFWWVSKFCLRRIENLIRCSRPLLAKTRPYDRFMPPNRSSNLAESRSAQYRHRIASDKSWKFDSDGCIHLSSPP